MAKNHTHEHADAKDAPAPKDVPPPPPTHPPGPDEPGWSNAQAVTADDDPTRKSSER